MAADGEEDRRLQVRIVGGRRDHERDVGARRDRMRPFDVERGLGRPALIGGRRTAAREVHPEIRPRQIRQSVDLGEGLRVGGNGRRADGIDDDHRLTRAVEPGRVQRREPVGGLQLARLVAAGRQSAGCGVGDVGAVAVARVARRRQAAVGGERVLLASPETLCGEEGPRGDRRERSRRERGSGVRIDRAHVLRMHVVLGEAAHRRDNRSGRLVDDGVGDVRAERATAARVVVDRDVERILNVRDRPLCPHVESALIDRHDAQPVLGQVFLDPVSLGRRRREQRVGFGLAQPAVEARRALIVELANELLRGGLRARRLQPQRDRDRFGCVRGPQVLGFAGRRRRVVRDGARLHRGAGRDRCEKQRRGQDGRPTGPPPASRGMSGKS